MQYDRIEAKRLIFKARTLLAQASTRLDTCGGSAEEHEQVLEKLKQARISLAKIAQNVHTDRIEQVTGEK